ncbi:hypothetical protein T439DRAFT_43506 [Meredithblackwellia eburnea MCA 4105]
MFHQHHERPQQSHSPKVSNHPLNAPLFVNEPHHHLPQEPFGPEMPNKPPEDNETPEVWEAFLSHYQNQDSSHQQQQQHSLAKEMALGRRKRVHVFQSTLGPTADYCRRKELAKRAAVELRG